MRRVFISFAILFALSPVGWAFNPSCFLYQSIESKDLGANGDTVPEFVLGGVRFITDNSGSKECKNGWIRNSVEWCLYRSYNDGTLLVQAQEGYWIRDITLSYDNKNSGGILCDQPGASQKPIAAYASGKAIVVNDTVKQFYVGKNSEGNGGYLSITKFEVNYCKKPTSIALQNDTIRVGETFQLAPQTLPEGSDAIYTWQSNQSNVVSVDSNGVISAKAVGEATITVSFDTVSTSCLITVLPADSAISVVETFSNCTVESNRSGTTQVVGDNALYDWSLHYYQRQLSGNDDKVGGKQGTRIIYNGYIATNGVQEGGVKSIAFDWRTANAVNMVNYGVNVGDFHYEYTSDAVNNNTVYHFERLVEVKTNTAVSVNMAAKIGATGQTYVICGPLTIIPYLLFNLPNHQDLLSVQGTAETYNLKKWLINNTGEAPMFEVTGNTTGATTSIEDGILHISNLAQNGAITVQASWNNQQVTTSMTLLVDKLPEPLAGEKVTETFANCKETKLYDGRVHVVGDNGLYDWSMARFQRLEDDTICGVQGTRIRYNGSVESNGVQEGGVKELAFFWHVTGVDMPVHFFVSVGDSVVEYCSTPVPPSAIKRFLCPFLQPRNTTISVSVSDQDNPAQSFIVISPLTITPYLLFKATDHLDTIDVRLATSYDLRDVLIDNTDGEGTISFAITSDATGAAVLNGSVVDLSAVTRNGFVELEARWGEVSATMALWVVAEPETGLKRVQNAECTMHNYKIMKNGQLRIWRGGEYFSVIGNKIK